MEVNKNQICDESSNDILTIRKTNVFPSTPMLRMEVDLSLPYMTHPKSQSTQTRTDQLPYEPQSQQYQSNSKTLASINLREHDNAKPIYSSISLVD